MSPTAFEEILDDYKIYDALAVEHLLQNLPLEFSEMISKVLVENYDFKKNHLFADEILKDYEELQESEIDELEKEVENAQILEPDPEKEEITQISIPKETNLAQEKSILQKKDSLMHYLSSNTSCPLK